MKPLKIVLISFQIYPVISARSFRTTELAKEFVKKGHHVTLYAVLGDYDYTHFMKETGIVVKNLGEYKENNFYLTNILGKIIRILCQFPKIKLIPLIKRAIKREKSIDYLITIAAPHVIHWGAVFAKLDNIKCWCADCGDPYMLNPFGYHPFYFKFLEKRWCRKTDFITVPIEDAKKAYYKEFRNKIYVIPQGFDFSNVQLQEYDKNQIPTFAYTGNCYKNNRDITLFLEYLSSLSIEFKFIVYTKSLSFFKPFEEKLGEKMELREYVPRELLLTKLSKMDFLINIRNEFSVQRPSKLIDYYITQRPILEIGSQFNESQYFNEFIHHDYSHKLETNDISEYHISNVCDRFIDLYYKKINKDINPQNTNGKN